MRQDTLKLFLASFLGLFFELLFIRWLPDAIHVFSFFGNFVLLSCFLGLGVGLARTVGEDESDGAILGRFLWLSSSLIALFCLFIVLQIDVPPPNEGVFLNDDAYIQGPRPLHVNIYLSVAVFCTLIALVFIPLGKLLNRYLSRHEPLHGYTVNILASLLGIAAFSLLSFLCTPPPVWLALGLALLLPFAERKLATAAFGTVLVLGLTAFGALVEHQQKYQKLWSPYYNIRVFTQEAGDIHVYIGNSCLLTGSDLSEERGNEIHRVFYNFPYRFLPDPKRVLVLGSGMGNDVSMALQHGAEQVDAVEIDPIIARLGRERHPQHPYQDPRVRVINDDARSFIKRATGPYDLIIFGTLDSHGLFSHMSSIKMENYVYTRECFAEARRLLSDRGVMYVNVGFMGKFVPLRLFNTLREVFGREPEFYFFRNLFSLYVAGNIPPGASGEDAAWQLSKAQINWDAARGQVSSVGLVPTDDWPQLYLKDRRIPVEYQIALAILLAVSLAMIRLGVARSSRWRLDPHFFFLGAGFMLIETKSITELGLMFGSTWIVNSVVIAGILTMIFLANLYLLRSRAWPNQKAIYAWLGALLVGLYLLPLRGLGLGGSDLALAGVVVPISLPLLFAALIFGTSFAGTDTPSASLASNMLGAMVGGALEYTSMMFGQRSLYLTALLLYALSYLGRRGSPEKSEPPR